MVRALHDQTPATYEDVLAAPEGKVAELLNGALYLRPRPARPQGRAASRLGALLIPGFELGRGGPGGWWIEDEPELRLGEDVLVPDLAGWRREVVPAFDTSVSYVTMAPQWVCEVLSPSTAAKDRVLKLPKYAAAGVEHAWLVDPLALTLEVLEAMEDGTWRLIGAFEGEATVTPRPFDALPMELSDLWIESLGPTY
ncbi:MAG: Uma2 family endonuclease [Myxococcota bacterium]